MKRAEWEGEAENWVAWARTAGHDAYWDYAPLFFDDVVPDPRVRTLEVGCGEGRVTRDLLDRRHRVTGLDASPTLITAAYEADDRAAYVRADAAALPFANGSFDLIVSYNSLMDFDDMPRAVREAARVLASGGHLAMCVVHPIADAGAFESRSAASPFHIEGSYFAERSYRETFERDGLRMTFSSMAYPLEAYARALEDAGFLIDRIREPAAPADVIERDPRKRGGRAYLSSSFCGH